MKNQAWSRRLLLAGAAALVMLTAGDAALTQVVAPDVGIDPLEVLSLSISPNVAILLDTSGSMGAPFTSTDTGNNNPAVGGDDFSSKMYQAKKAIRTVVAANAGMANFGLLSYAVRNTDKDITYGNSAVADADRGVKYVSDQTSAAFWTGGNDKTVDSTSDFFGGSRTPNTGTSAGAVYGSFAAFGAVLDMGTLGENCDTLGQCRWFLSSLYIRSNVRYRWTSTSAMTASTIDCSTDANRAPLRLFPDDPHAIVATKTDYARPCVQMENSSGAVTTFWYTSVAWTNPDSQCDGAALITPVPGCMSNDPQAVLDGLKLELPVDGSCQNASSVATPVGAPCGITPTGASQNATDINGTNPALNPNTMEGLTAGGRTPLSASLEWINANRTTVFANQVAGQPNYVIMVTDGIDSCSGAATAATWAGTLYANGITVFVIAMGIDADLVEDIADSGSGGQYGPFSAQNPQGLVDALNSIITQTAEAGHFSAQPSATASVFEFGDSTVFPEDDRIDPDQGNRAMPRYRFSKVVPATFQPMFEMPGFVGHLKAYLAPPPLPPPAPQVPGAPVEVWDAGDQLCRQVTGFPATTVAPAKCDVTGAHASAMGNASFIFADMTGDNGGPPSYTQTTGRLKRRIFTTSGNGVFPYAAGPAAGPRQQLVPLWPPTTDLAPAGVDPGYDSGTSTYPTGRLDAALGIEWLDFATLQTTFGACRVGTVGVLHAHCSVAATRLSRARKEAREMILAYAAGAMVATTGGLPNRTDNSGPASGRGEILYKAKDWMLADSTLSSVVAVTQPLRLGPAGFHAAEYASYREQFRDTPSPRMSVVYLGANDMLHAFRAGPGGAELGGEELWGFVPFDQLSKLRLLLVEGQDRGRHKYVVASGLRAADVFVPSAYDTTTGDPTAGAWRTLLFFGRGIGGKHYTALDVSNPGTYTTPALTTTPPLAVWSRGNPDTQDGTAAGAANYLLNDRVATPAADDVDLGVTDADAYLTMGQTWSSPSLARVRTVTDATDPTPDVTLNQRLEFMLYAGSGYSSVAEEGHNFYSINPLTGDIITSADVGSGTGSTIPNAIVAGPAVFNPGQLTLKEAHPASSVGTRVYVGDLHGRLWKFLTDDPSTGVKLWDLGVGQPIATSVGLLNYDSRYDDTDPLMKLEPHIYVATGNDRRVPTPPAQPDDFLFVGVRDQEERGTLPIAKELFRFVLDERYRGTSQPSTFLTSDLDGASARVVVAFTRFNPITAATCRSSFDSRIYMVSAGLGQAVSDVNNDSVIDDQDAYWEIPEERVTGVRVTHGQIVVDKGLNPLPDSVPGLMGNAGSGSPLVYAGSTNSVGSTVCR